MNYESLNHTKWECKYHAILEKEGKGRARLGLRLELRK